MQCEGGEGECGEVRRSSDPEERTWSCASSSSKLSDEEMGEPPATLCACEQTAPMHRTAARRQFLRSGVMARWDERLLADVPSFGGTR
jgi:hypothetical protein